MTTDRPPTIGDQADRGLGLYVVCNACRRLPVRLGPTEVVRLLGREAPVYGAWRRFRCAACGARGRVTGEVFSYPEQPPNGVTGGFRSRHA